MKYDIIVSDNPWFYNKRNAGTKFGTGANKYPLIKHEELLGLSDLVKGVSADNCALFMWATMPKLKMAIELIDSWGFRYATNAFTWIKLNKDGSPFAGPGNYTSTGPELVLLGIKGSMLPDQKLVNSVIMSQKMRHSQKPEEIQDRIDLMYKGDRKRLEMFARRPRDGWTTVGLDIDGKDIRDSLSDLTLI